MFGCDGISDHASWNEVFHYRDTKLSCTEFDVTCFMHFLYSPSGDQQKCFHYQSRGLWVKGQGYQVKERYFRPQFSLIGNVMMKGYIGHDQRPLMSKSKVKVSVGLMLLAVGLTSTSSCILILMSIVCRSRKIMVDIAKW